MSCPKPGGTACVIGAGISGLTAIKHLLEYGISVVCYEQSENFGGLWRYNDGDRQGYGAVMRNTILNTSKEFVAFSDFPMPAEEPNFMRNDRFYCYIRDYAEHFDLLRHVQFGTAVKEVRRAPSYDEAGDWCVTTERAGDIKVTTFSYVMVCVGHHVQPHTPALKNIQLFRGQVSHSHDYKTFHDFVDRRVLVVGLGNSGGDVACELARVAKQVICSIRHGTWVARRVVQRGYPRDVLLRTRHYERMQNLLPASIRSRLSLMEFNTFLDHSLYGIRPIELPGQSPVLLADDLPLYLSSGFVKIRPDIARFTEGAVHYVDGNCDEVDNVIFCTGYDFKFDFIEDGTFIPSTDNQFELWRRIFPPLRKWNSLAVIGLIDPLGPTATACEMQSRAVAHIWAYGINLPSDKEMLDEIRAEKTATAIRYRCSAKRASLQTDFVSYMDQLATVVGCMPNLGWKFRLTDPQLAFWLHFGPVTPHHYRLHGRHAWPQAREQILGTMDRVHRAMLPAQSTFHPPPVWELLLTPHTRVIGWFTVAVLSLSIFLLITFLL